MGVPNRDEVKGKAKKAAGDAKRAVGDWTGDEETTAEGDLDRAEGQIQETYGKARREAGDPLGDDDALLHALVGEHLAADHVADRVHVLRRAEAGVDLDEPALVGLAADPLEREPVRDRLEAERDEDRVGDERLIDTRAPSFPASIEVTFVETRMSRPCFRKTLFPSLDRSGSIPGRIVSSASTIVTFVPTRW